MPSPRSAGHPSNTFRLGSVFATEPGRLPNVSEEREVGPSVFRGGGCGRDVCGGRERRCLGFLG